MDKIITLIHHVLGGAVVLPLVCSVSMVNLFFIHHYILAIEVEFFIGAGLGLLLTILEFKGVIPDSRTDEGRVY